ncbi:LpqB family beta-propeller domain-containing protein [Actinotalea sp. K2]|uniref:LpqB family beta-propeller domain-containing protein n=1 Tax=Actinotalea sp. K2 TaxID=2939438 RepID=UPI0020179D79|nr:LpqB family beta-propeller domain-containing protein [Actinotalea sp. K2]MCL3862669.1 LpqB family beta-propeller domain-containing protein [Actinotalea sp. K2]
MRPSAPGASWSATLRAVCGVMLLGVMTGCVGIPVAGPVEVGEAVGSEPGLAFPVADEPSLDDGPQEIVTGFLNASTAGLYDEFVVARKYLTTQAAAQWDPRARVLVYPVDGGSPEIEAREDGVVVVSVPVEATVDAEGRYLEAVPNARTEVVFEMFEDAAGQWRVAGLDNGVMMAAPAFARSYRQTAIYFASQDRTHLVPETRWFPRGNLAVGAVSAVLAGPSTWLQDAVSTGVPEGTRLSSLTGVTVTDRVARVDLSPDARRASEEDRGLLLAQLEAALTRLPGTVVSSVEISVGGVAWVPGAVPELLREVPTGAGPYVVDDGRLAVVDGGNVTPVVGAAPLSDLDVRRLGVSLDEQVVVALVGSGRLVELPTDGGEPVDLVTGANLLAPSFDRQGWVWTGERASSGSLTAVRPGDEAVVVGAEWLESRTVQSVRVARDGARVVVAHSGPGGSDLVMDLAAVVRGQDGTPQLLSEERVRVGTVLEGVTDMAWVDEGRVAVLGRSGDVSVPTVHLVTLGGSVEDLTTPEGAVSLAARGDRALFVVDESGRLHSWQNAAWVAVATGVEAPTFPG